MSAESQAECPLCMEPLELDDINFFPCTCGYQVCRFCWHRIRTDENGLCPACRKCYTEDPAEFKPIPSRDLQKMLKDKKQKDSQKRQKAAENRKHLTNVRVLQNNLVFVVGLSKRLADAAVLKKHTNFGKFGKIHKVVVNQSTTYAGSQGPSASAYITYYKSDDAIRAIQSVNNVLIDGRMVKASLGTTKYCSYYLRGLSCPKSDCMYLHELGDSGASFTKEQMQQGIVCNTMSGCFYNIPVIKDMLQQQVHVAGKFLGQKEHCIMGNRQLPEGCQPSEFLKHLEYEQMLHDAFKAAEKATCSVPSHLPDKTPSIKAVSVQNASKASSRKSIPVRKSLSRYSSRSAKLSVVPSVAANKFESMEMLEASNNQRIAKEVISQKIVAAGQHNHEGVPKSAGFPSRQLEDGQPFTDSCQHPCNENNCNMLIDDPSDDITDNTQDDDLGFDPWDESSRGLADMMEKENEHLRNSFVTPSKITTNLCSNSIGKTSSSRQGSISNRVPTLPLQNSLSLSTHGCLSQDYPAYNLRSGLQQSNAACSRTGRQTNHHMGAGRQSNQTINHEYHAFKQQANNNIQKNVTGLPSNTGCHQVAPPVHKHPFNIPNWIMTSKQKAPNTRPDHLNRGWIAFTQAFD